MAPPTNMALSAQLSHTEYSSGKKWFHITTIRGLVLRIIFPILVPCLCPRMVFSASLCAVLVAGVAGPCEKWNEDFFPSGEKQLALDQPRVRRASSLLYIPNHLSFKGMFMFAHFSLPIVPKESELVRIPLVMCLPIATVPLFLVMSGRGGTISTSYRNILPFHAFFFFLSLCATKCSAQMTIKW